MSRAQHLPAARGSRARSRRRRAALATSPTAQSCSRRPRRSRHQARTRWRSLAPTGAHFGERQHALQLALHHGMLVAADRARLPDHLLLDVLVQLLQAHDAVAVEVAGALEPLGQVVGEDAVAQLGQLHRDLARPRGGDDRAPLGAGQPIEEQIVHAHRPGSCARRTSGRRPRRCSRRRGTSPRARPRSDRRSSAARPSAAPSSRGRRGRRRSGSGTWPGRRARGRADRSRGRRGRRSTR